MQDYSLHEVVMVFATLVNRLDSFLPAVLLAEPAEL